LTLLQISTNFGSLNYFLLFNYKFSPAGKQHAAGDVAHVRRRAGGTVTARGLHARQRSGALAGVLVAAIRRQGVAGKYQWDPVVAPGQEEGAGADQGGGSTARECKRLRRRRSTAVGELRWPAVTKVWPCISEEEGKDEAAL
jgi:hypothetical protein